MSADDNAVIPLHLVFEDDAQAWSEAQPASVRQWMREQGWNAEKNRALLIAGADGRMLAAAYGMGKRVAQINLWQVAGMPERLPPKRYRLAHPVSDTAATHIGLGFAYGSYRFERYRRTPAPRLATLDPPDNADRRLVTRLDEGLRMGRNFINTPASDFGPAQLGAEAAQLAQGFGAAFRLWQGEELLSAGFPAIHAVGRASAQAPRLAEIRWSPPGAAGQLPQLVIVGKGVCFDSGGLDIKPASGMLLMKKDMGGAAAALALAHMLMDARIRARLRVLIPAVENSIGSDAYRPGDVLKTRKGLSVEVGNTDAEGRLVLCDALAAADEEPCDLIIDFATLTGAARVALGPDLPAVFGSSESIVGELTAVATQEADPIWPMPLWMGYDDELASKVADLNNVSASPFAGAIIGALFLKRFVTANPRWVHVDLFAWNPKERPGRPIGAELQSVRAFYRYLVGRYGADA
jgi:leucyl aminopeptidase